MISGYQRMWSSCCWNAVTIIICMSLSAAESWSIGLPCRPDQRICYIVYKEPFLKQADAAAECRVRHANGRLMVVPNHGVQTSIDEALRARVSVAPHQYWMGVKMSLTESWTWFDNDVYRDRSWLRFSPEDSHPNHTYATVRKVRSGATFTLQINTIEISDLPQAANSRSALCQCSTCTGDARYSTIPARRWYDARNRCINAFGGADLAVLSDEDVRLYESILREDMDYFIGLRRVRLLREDPTGTQMEAAYTNWNDASPRYLGNNTCVYASAYNNWTWFTAPCDFIKPFACEYDNLASTKAASTRTTTSTRRTTTPTPTTTTVTTTTSSSSSSSSSSSATPVVDPSTPETVLRPDVMPMKLPDPDESTSKDTTNLVGMLGVALGTVSLCFIAVLVVLVIRRVYKHKKSDHTSTPHLSARRPRPPATSVYTMQDNNRSSDLYEPYVLYTTGCSEETYDDINVLVGQKCTEGADFYCDGESDVYEN